MKRTYLVRLGSAALLAAGMAAAFAAPANAAPADSTSSEIQAALQRDLGLDAQQAEVRFQQERVAFSKEKTLRIALGGDYAGSQFDATSGKLMVFVSDASRVADVQAVGALATVVEHSAADLDAAASQLAQASMPKSVAGWYVDHASNAVVVEATSSDAAAWAQSLGSAVRVERVAELPQTYWNVINGQAITRSGSRCSGGFNARSGSARYVITAGHCTSGGGTWSGPGGTLGPASGASFPGNDYGRITISSTAAVQTGLVDRWNSGSDVRVTGSSNGNVGAAVCRSGSTTGWRCGTITALNATVNYAQGSVSGLIRTNACAQPGDSGGSLVTNGSSTVTALGMTSGGSGNCSTGGTTFFQPVNEALSVYGLSLVTG